MNKHVISRPFGPVSGSAFTLVELLVVLTIIAVLAGIVLPVTGKVRDNARTSKTVSNLRQLQIANISFANENNGLFVSAFDALSWGNGWKGNQDFLKYVTSEGWENAGPVLRSGFPQAAAIIAYNTCKVPSSSGSGADFYWTYGAKMALRQTNIEQPNKLVAFIDCTDWWVSPDSWNNWESADKSDTTGQPYASVAYRNNKKAAAVTFGGNAVMLERADLNKDTPEGKSRWFYDGQ